MIATRLLKQFIVVAEELHFHKAAIRLHMAQPPLSQAINRLEEKLGFSLFIRNKRGVKLTPAGIAFQEAAYNTLRELELGIEHARNVSEGIAGKLTITSISIAHYEPLLHVLRHFRETFDKTQLALLEASTSRQEKILLSGEADIAFMRKLPALDKSIESRLILEEQIVLALPAEHPKATNSQVNLQDFKNEDFVLTPRRLGNGYYDQLIDLCSMAGFYPKVTQEAEKVRTLLSLVACGFGVALVPESIANFPVYGEVAFCYINPVKAKVNPSIGLYMNWAIQNHSPLLRGFINLLNFDEKNFPIFWGNSVKGISKNEL